MYTDKEIFKKLEEIYSKAAYLFDRGGKNFCGNCYFCCTTHIVQGISRIEYDYMQKKLEEEGKGRTIKVLKDYIRKKRDLKGDLFFEICPLYNREKGGCSIYTFRPFSCRFYGYYAPVPPPLFCPYNKRTIIYSVESLYKTVPLVKSFLEIKNLYNIYMSTSQEDKAKNLYQMGYDLYFQGETEKAEVYLKEALQLKPDCWRSKFQLSQLYYNKGDINEAINMAESADKDKKNKDVKIHLALLYLHINSIKEAADLVIDVLDENEEDKIALSIMSHIFYMGGNKKKAFHFCRKALLLDPSIPLANTVLNLLMEE